MLHKKESSSEDVTPDCHYFLIYWTNNTCFIIICFPVEDIMYSQNNLSFFTKPFSYMTKHIGHKNLNILKTKRLPHQRLLQYFQRTFIEANKNNFFERWQPDLILLDKDGTIQFELLENANIFKKLYSELRYEDMKPEPEYYSYFILKFLVQFTIEPRYFYKLHSNKKCLFYTVMQTSIQFILGFTLKSPECI